MPTPRSYAPPAQEGNKQRHADDRRDGSQWELRRRDDGTSGGVGDENEGRAQDRRSGQQKPVIAAPRETDRVRDDETDEPDDAGGGDGRGREQRRGRERQPFRAFNRDAEVRGGILADRERVERPR